MKPGARDKEAIAARRQLFADPGRPSWVGGQIAGIDPLLLAAQQTWGLALTGMLTGNETFFPPYMAERNRRWIAEQFAQAGADAETMRRRCWRAWRFLSPASSPACAKTSAARSRPYN